jgi:hypothetical protein
MVVGWNAKHSGRAFSFFGVLRFFEELTIVKHLLSIVLFDTTRN